MLAVVRYMAVGPIVAISAREKLRLLRSNKAHLKLLFERFPVAQTTEDMKELLP
jgi:hypothetical protein